MKLPLLFPLDIVGPYIDFFLLLFALRASRFSVSGSADAESAVSLTVLVFENSVSLMVHNQRRQLTLRILKGSCWL
jgi:hypothetical protein